MKQAAGLYLILGALLCAPAFGAQPETLELETLRIKGYIHEPQVLLILEEPSVELLTLEEKQRHDFLEEFDKPLLELIQ